VGIRVAAYRIGEERVRAHRNDIYVLYGFDQEASARTVAGHFSLVFDRGGCQTAKTGYSPPMPPMARFCFACFAAPRVRLDVIAAAAVDAVVAARNRQQHPLCRSLWPTLFTSTWQT
jgi:hypothetical protein